MWLAMSPFVLKHLPQTSHLNFLKSECLKVWLLRALLVGNLLPHSSHS
ncbi:hypothetical protein E2C01_047523 [Portunus trituberculatus]|uniref:Uncharacterized protein n=1 Tax=Portunus trituberculatus TaxID=210409 RepID=A0A5B7G853_PORTR|nr:hypothetical protein [Portunus trituberculatus]